MYEKKKRKKKKNENFQLRVYTLRKATNQIPLCIGLRKFIFGLLAHSCLYFDGFSSQAYFLPFDYK